MRVNGREVRVEVDPDTPLVYVLRNDLNLKGVRFGCGLEQCGACKVLIDGEAVPSCRLPVGDVSGREVITVEGLGAPAKLHPVQAAFIEEQAAQCGFCTSGLVIATAELLQRHPHPTDVQIREALDIHLCRCGSHARVLRAVRCAARERAS